MLLCSQNLDNERYAVFSALSFCHVTCILSFQKCYIQLGAFIFLNRIHWRHIQVLAYSSFYFPLLSNSRSYHSHIICLFICLFLLRSSREALASQLLGLRLYATILKLHQVNLIPYSWLCCFRFGAAAHSQMNSCLLDLM